MGDHTVGRSSKRMVFDAHFRAGCPKLRYGGRFAKRHRAPGALLQKLRPRRNAPKVDGIAENHDTIRIDAFGMNKTIAARVVNGDIRRNLREVGWRLYPKNESMANVDCWDLGKVD